MKTIKTWEIYKMIDENSESMVGKEYKLTKKVFLDQNLNIDSGDVVDVGQSIFGNTAIFHKGRVMCSLLGFEEWEEVKEPVSFMEVVESGRRIKIEDVVEEVKNNIADLEAMIKTQLSDGIMFIQLQLEREQIKLAALEKQVAKKVTKAYTVISTPNDTVVCGECPTCKHTGLMRYKHDCCWWCGQKLDWGTENGDKKEDR